ncbi:hypothetical protein [Bradyrhizobium sp. RT5a]|uniref:hypothetical protein n=1 Tax=unclassified Bradyrhizobium TaxID=2631580 RepID=UPI0033930C55
MADSNGIAPEILELILRTSRLSGCDQIYSLAPRGHRVAFYFQQRRATLLAAAIANRLGEGALKTCRIGIIGGGVSGLTLLLALNNEGAHQVSLYEANESLLTKGERASHRLVHPNYNRWPMLGSMDMFTSLPVLNWYADSADNVVEQLRDQLQRDYKVLLRNSVKKKHIAKKITQRASSLANPLQVVFDNEGTIVEYEFQIVVIAAGFGDESSTNWGFKDYWTREEDFDKDTHTRPCTVYGLGDGALIDILRCCARSPDDAWRIPLGVIARLRSDHATELFRDNSEVKVRSPTFEPFEKKIQAHEESLRSVAWAMTRSSQAIANGYARDESHFYLQCIDELKTNKGDLIDFLEEQLKPVARTDLRPLLVGALDYAFEPTAAPINKLLLAYLLVTERISYVPTTKKQQVEELEHWRAQTEIERRSKITICRFGAPKNFPLKKSPSGRGKAKRTTPAHGVEVVVRSKTVFSETQTEEHLVDALAGITGGEYVLFDAMPHRVTVAHFGDDNDKVTSATIAKNKPILLKFAKDNLDATDVDFQPRKKSRAARWVIITNLDNERIRERLMNLGGLDGNFFGTPIVLNPTPSRDSGAAI